MPAGKGMSLRKEHGQYRGTVGIKAAVGAVALLLAGVAGAQEQAASVPHVHAAQPPKPGVTTPGVQRPLSELHPMTVFPVEGSPDWSVMTKSAVWITSARANHVVQLLPEAGKPGLVVEIPRPCSGLA